MIAHRRSSLQALFAIRTPFGCMVPLHYLGMKKDYYVNYHFTYGMPTVIVDQTMFDHLQKETDPQKKKVHIGIHLTDETNIERADQLFQRMEFSSIADSRLMMSRHQKQTFGLIMFVVTFLGLAFLVTSGCILYFKQMGAGEEERPNYTICANWDSPKKTCSGAFGGNSCSTLAFRCCWDCPIAISLSVPAGSFSAPNCGRRC